MYYMIKYFMKYFIIYKDINQSILNITIFFSVIIFDYHYVMFYNNSQSTDLIFYLL